MIRWCLHKILEIVGLQEALPIDDTPARKSPSPPPKKAKVEPEPVPPNFTLPLHDATIDEGSRFTFECRMSGIPTPEICWLKDNISIDSNLDYHTKVEDDGLCSLTIEETFTEDSACFTCRATNSLGYAETTALLTVRENERESPPVFVRCLAPVRSKEGSPCSLVCKVEGIPLPTVQWFKNGVCVDSVANYKTTYNNGEAVLNIEELKMVDQGQFSCRATNRLGTETTSALLTVEPLISEKAPMFTTPLSNVMARAGQKIKLECELTGVPEPQLVWTHNGKSLPDNRDIKFQYERGKVILTIPEAFPKDAGTYNLTAQNNAGTTTSSCTVAVKGRLPTETSDSELASDLEPFKPSIPTALKDSTVFESGLARLDCVIIGQPEPEVIWYHEGVPIKESKEVQLLFQGDRCSLIIAETLLDDAGLYKVVAINSAGEASSSCQLTVQKSGIESEQSADAVPESKEVGTKPLFISLLTDALVTEGELITLECAVRGDPSPNITWFLNNNPLQLSDRLKVEQDPGGLCTLLFNPAVAEDKGVYTVKAANCWGEAKCFAHLIVKSATNLPSTAAHTTDIQLEERATIPAFIELFADRTVSDGGSTKFECIITGKPTPKVRWFFKDEPVSGKDFLVSVSGSRQVLTIPSVSKTFSGGKITCSAENEAGKANCSAKLTVTDAPPVDDLLSSIDQLNLSEMSVFEVKREVFMQSESRTQFGSGEPVVQVHGKASKTELTSQKTGEKPAVQVETHKTSEYHSVDGVEQKMDVQTKTTSVAESGTIVPSKVSPQRKQIPPRFVTPIMGKIVDQGSDVILECIVEGFPTPLVAWKKNGKDLIEGNKLRTNWQLNKAQCALDSVTVGDAGKYSCTVTNPLGTATCTADLVVKKNVFPPVFGRRLQADTVLAGKRAVMEVEVSGTPDPDVTWYKDGHQIATSSSMYRVLAQGNSHRLIIEQAGHSHSGRYEVRAVNSGGEALSCADLLIVEPTDLAVTLSPGVKMDSPQLADASLPKQTVSITESFKSDKKMTIHVEQSTVQLDSNFDVPSVNPICEVLPLSTSTKQFQHVMQDDKMKARLEPAKEIFTSAEEPLPPKETVIEDSSISKKSALSYFKNIIKENEEDTKALKSIEPSKKASVPHHLPSIMPSLPPIYVENPLTTTEIFSQISFKDSSQKFESIYTNEGTVLYPEPPPEMGFISKSQVIKGKEDMAEKVKKLEESHKVLSQEQIPSGGVRIFPTMKQVTSETTFAQPSLTTPKQHILSDTITTTTSFQQEYAESSKPSFPEICKLPENKFSSPLLPTIEVPKPYNSSEQMASESYNSFQSSCTKSEIISEGNFDLPKFEPFSPIIRPSAGIELRPQSPRPSAEGIHMEKLWTSKQKEEYVEFPHASPTTELLTPVQQFPKQMKTSEKTSFFEETKRTASPLPSATGLAMERLWTPTLDNQRPLSALSVGERPKSPSAEGLAMDKLWAHKVSTQKKVWPPPQTSEDSQPIPPWTNKTNVNFQPETTNVSSEPSFQKEVFSENYVKVESESLRKVESSTLSYSKLPENVTNTQSAFKEVTPTKAANSYIPQPTKSKIIYVAEAHASHSTNIPVVQPQIRTETNFVTSSQTIEKSEKTTSNSTVFEEKVVHPYESVSNWPPGHKEESLYKQEIKKNSSSTIVSDGVLGEIHLEPGPPPEIGFAEPPRRKQSYVETIEHDLEKTMDKVPSRHLAGAVRIIPPPQKKSSSKESTIKVKKSQEMVQEKKVYMPESISKPLPKLEPFPFKAEPPKEKPAKCPPPPRPSKFVKGSFTESDYESDCDSVRIPVKWNPWQSDSEDYSYRKVKPPTATSVKRPHSAASQAVPPSQFENPTLLHGPSTCVVTQSEEISKSSKNKTVRSEETSQKHYSGKESTKFMQSKTSPTKPGSPPYGVDHPANKHKAPSKPSSPKTKPKNVQTLPPESGYMADTDEPSRQFKMMRTEESMTTRMEQSVSYEQSRSEVKTVSSSDSRTSTKKESSKSELESSYQKKNEQPLEPFPFKPDPARPTKRTKGPPPPSPSKFIKGEFRESDYESEYEGKIRPVWRPTELSDDLSFRPVRPILTPVSGKSQNGGIIPTPPTEFDEPPSFSGPPRPKFEPIDKPLSATKVKEVVVEKTKLIRPTPVQAHKSPPIETITATPASKSVADFILKPGSPPKMDYAPPPGFVEKSNVVNFTESTENSKRVVSVQQTTRVMQFGSSAYNQVQRKENIPPTKFIPVFSKESDYESDVDGAVHKFVRTPYIDAEKKRLKRVEEMKRRFLESEPQLQPGEPPEFAYSPEPSKTSYSIASNQMNEMTQTFKGKTQQFVSDILTDMKSTKQKASNDKSILKPTGDEPQTYRDENRLSEFGTKQIDPDTGLIYFKYDFGYEFGVVLPGEQKPGAPRKVISGPQKKEEGAIDFPVIHESTQKKKPIKVKTVKWEPTSESEMSEIESERVHRGLRQTQLTVQTPSPHSISPSIQSLSPYPLVGHENTVSPGSPWLTEEGAQIVRAVSPGDQPKKAPLFITPLRDIACVSGQPARFECIVLAEPVPTISWSKDGTHLQQSDEHQMEYRNGVCRLVLPQARPYDAGQYTCTANNALGSTQTIASLQVPGERRSLYQ